jgi:hypothetical protein
MYFVIPFGIRSAIVKKKQDNLNFMLLKALPK